MTERTFQYTCYPSHPDPGEINPLLSITSGSKYDPLVVEITTGAKDGTIKPYVRIYRNGMCIAHSAVEYKNEQ